MNNLAVKMATEPDTTFIPDTPIGPLDEYRKRATFNWKHLRLIFEDGKLLKLKYMAWSKIDANPLFSKPRRTLSADEQKRRAAIQMNEINALNLAPPEIEKLSYRNRVCFCIRNIFVILQLCGEARQIRNNK